MTLTEEKLTKAEQAADLLMSDLKALRDQIVNDTESNIRATKAIAECTVIMLRLRTIREKVTKDAGQ